MTAVVAALGLVGAGGAAAQAVPDPDDKFVVTVGCPDGDDGFEDIDVLAQGAIGFVLDESGAPTREKVFIVQIDAASWADDGTLLFEFSKTYGKRTGHGQQLSCSGTFVEDGQQVFFDVLLTRR